MRSRLHDFTGIVRGETDKALKIDYGGKEAIWLPKSQIEIEENRDGKTVTVTLPQWLAEEKGIV